MIEKTFKKNIKVIDDEDDVEIKEENQPQSKEKNNQVKENKSDAIYRNINHNFQNSKLNQKEKSQIDSKKFENTRLLEERINKIKSGCVSSLEINKKQINNQKNQISNQTNNKFLKYLSELYELS